MVNLRFVNKKFMLLLIFSILSILILSFFVQATTLKKVNVDNDWRTFLLIKDDYLPFIIDGTNHLLHVTEANSNLITFKIDGGPVVSWKNYDSFEEFLPLNTITNDKKSKVYVLADGSKLEMKGFFQTVPPLGFKLSLRIHSDDLLIDINNGKFSNGDLIILPSGDTEFDFKLVDYTQIHNFQLKKFTYLEKEKPNKNNLMFIDFDDFQYEIDGGLYNNYYDGNNKNYVPKIFFSDGSGVELKIRYIPIIANAPFPVPGSLEVGSPEISLRKINPCDVNHDGYTIYGIKFNCNEGIPTISNVLSDSEEGPLCNQQNVNELEGNGLCSEKDGTFSWVSCLDSNEGETIFGTSSLGDSYTCKSGNWDYYGGLSEIGGNNFLIDGLENLFVDLSLSNDASITSLLTKNSLFNFKLSSDGLGYSANLIGNSIIQIKQDNSLVSLRSYQVGTSWDIHLDTKDDYDINVEMIANNQFKFTSLK
jgi:hypothetical protein